MLKGTAAMRHVSRSIVFALAVAALTMPSWSLRPAAAPAAPTIEQFLMPGYPTEMVSARKVDRIAWTAYEHGRRNVYTASGPQFHALRVTNETKDDGVELSDLSISDDGAIVVFVRGTPPNREGWVANPTANPEGATRTIWAARTAGGAAWKLGEGTTPALSPDGRTVAYAKDGQIFSYAVARPFSASARDGSGRATADRGQVGPESPALRTNQQSTPWIKAWGTNSNLTWSPDGSKLAFVSNRVDHSLIGVYDVRTRLVTFLTPSVDHDTSPTWSPDGKRVAFIRRPGTPFGQQAHQGQGSIGNPDGPAYNPLTAIRSGRGGQGGRGGRGRGDAEPSRDPRPGLMTAAFTGGYTLSFWVADVATGEGKEFWHNTKDDKDFTAINAIQWAGADRVIFEAEPQEWVRWYSVSVTNSQPAPTTLTSGEGAVEQTSLSADGRYLFYATNAGDIERRHVWKVPTAGGNAEPLTKGDTIETYPAALASGQRVAVLGGGATRPFGVGLVPASGGVAEYIYPDSLAAGFPMDAQVVPQLVVTKAPDGLEIHNQIFLPKDLKPGEKRPAIVFVHGGPVRQMLLGYHYMHFYHVAYAVNQWLASRGYMVLSVNYRSGIGYGKSFRTAPNTGGRGNAEYQDVLAGGKYLQSRPDVDPNRVGIWGLSYGGVLTAQALARNSDVFKVGVDLAGVHLWGSSLDPESVSYKASAISAIDTWKSPVLLVHGDDDRNVQFSQTTGLVQLLRAHNVYHELIVFTDDTHEPLTHQRYLYAFNRLEEFIGRFLKGAPPRSTAGQPAPKQ
jgi:dipeptidyl-peptidase 4